MEDPFLKKATNQTESTLYENSRTRDCPLFCRSSPWTVIEEPTIEQGIDFEDVIVKDNNNPEYRKCI